ncbi:MAG: Tol-Pal system protein TolB, partial [Methylophilaceae bacterium]|nr:Tol-Pal system protein TolB [Methylophilaceae bacterium]
MFWPFLLRAELAIEISGGNAQQIPIVIPPVEGLAYNAPNNFNLIVAADLQRTGLFRIVRSKGTESIPN